MADGISLITLFSAPNDDALIVEHDTSRGIVISAQAGGRQVELCIPPAKWFPMARQIFESRASLSLMQLANDN